MQDLLPNLMREYMSNKMNFKYLLKRKLYTEINTDKNKN